MGVTFEEASKCPECHQPGQLVSKKVLGYDQGGGLLHSLECKNLLCVDVGSVFLVQTRADGTIPDRSTDAPTLKVYEPLSVYQESAARAAIQRIKEQDNG